MNSLKLPNFNLKQVCKIEITQIDNYYLSICCLDFLALTPKNNLHTVSNKTINFFQKHLLSLILVLITVFCLVFYKSDNNREPTGLSCPPCELSTVQGFKEVKLYIKE